MSKSKIKIRQVIGDAFLIVSGALVLGLLALPFLMLKGVDIGGVVSTSNTSLGSCYDLITATDVSNSALLASQIFLILVLAAACAVVLLGIVDLIGAFTGKKAFNVTFISRMVSVLFVAFAVAAFISIVAYVAQSGIDITETSGFDIYQIGTGYIMALVFSVVALLASFVAKTKKAKK